MPHLKPFSVSPYRVVHDLVLAYLYISCLTSLPPPSYYSNHGKHQYLCTSCYLLLLLCFLQVKCWTFVLQISINHTLDLICFPLYHQDGSVQFSCSIVSDSLRPHGLQHARAPCPSPTLKAYSNSNPLSQWCHLTISSSVVCFSSCLQSFPASGSFPISQFFSASASVLSMNIQDWLPLQLTGWISLQSKGLSRVFSNTTVQKHQFFGTQLSL